MSEELKKVFAEYAVVLRMTLVTILMSAIVGGQMNPKPFVVIAQTKPLQKIQKPNIASTPALMMTLQTKCKKNMMNYTIRFLMGLIGRLKIWIDYWNYTWI